MSYNKIILVGNCTKDGELKYTANGSGIYSNSIATSRKFTVNGEKREEVCFVDFTAFSRLSEVCNQYLRKGSKILVEGRLNFDQWVDNDGQKRSKHSVVVENMQMLDSKGDNAQSQQQQGQPQQQQYAPPQQQGQPQQQYQAPQQQQQHTAYQPQNMQQNQVQQPQQPQGLDISDENLPF